MMGGYIGDSCGIKRAEESPMGVNKSKGHLELADADPSL